MGTPKGFYLYINLPASQVRRRLKGFGHGVRKIQSGGRNRAFVIHTATGRNLEKLKAKFADIGCAEKEEHLQEPIENLRNLGKASARLLHGVGVTTIEDLQRRDPVMVYHFVHNIWPETTENLLWAMAAGLQDRDWRDLRESEKNHLRKQLKQVIRSLGF